MRPSRSPLGGDAAHHQAARFLLVGATTVAIDFVVYQLLLALGVLLDPAKALSFVVATVCAYLFNRSFTFRASGGGHVVRRFVLLYSLALVVNVGVNALVLWALAGPGGFDAGSRHRGGVPGRPGRVVDPQLHRDAPLGLRRSA